MTKYRVYNKIYHKGKPRGRAFVTAEVQASSKAQAEKKVARDNKKWNAMAINKREKVSAHIVKVVALTKKGTIKGGKRKKRTTRNPFAFRF